MIKLIDIVKEIKIKPNIKYNTLLDFVKGNIVEILETIKKEVNDFEGSTGIINFKNLQIELGPIDDLDENIPEDYISISITHPNAEECEGINISNYGQEIQDLIGSGSSYHIIPSIQWNNKNIYWEIAWC